MSTNVTAAVGRVYSIDMSGATANFTHIFPLVVNEGDTWGLLLVKESPTYKIIHDTNGHNISVEIDLASMSLYRTGQTMFFTKINGFIWAIPHPVREGAMPPGGSIGQVLVKTGSKAFDVAWQTVAGVSGIMPVSQGGTGASSLTGILKGNGTAPIDSASVNIDFLDPSSPIRGGSF